MARTIPNLGNRITVLRAAWRELAPQDLFAGMTLTEFETATAPSLTLRDEILALEKQLEGRKADRMTADNTVNTTMELLVNSVRGTPGFGQDSSLYRAMGYIRKSERSSGLTRKDLRKTRGANAA